MRIMDARKGALTASCARFTVSAHGWLGRQDSNLGMAESKSAALPLGYAPTGGSLPPWRADHSGEAWTDQRPLTGPTACPFDGSAVELSPSWRGRQWAREQIAKPGSRDFGCWLQHFCHS